MLEIGEVLEPKSDATRCRVVGVEGDSYNVTVADEFGPIWKLTADDVAAGYVTQGKTLLIEQLSEAEAWAQNGQQMFDELERRSHDFRTANPEPTPEQAFAVFDRVAEKLKASLARGPMTEKGLQKSAGELGETYAAVRDRLLEQGILVKEGDKLRLG